MGFIIPVLEEKETGTFEVVFKNSGLVAPKVEESNQILEDLKQLATLRGN